MFSSVSPVARPGRGPCSLGALLGAGAVLLPFLWSRAPAGAEGAPAGPRLVAAQTEIDLGLREPGAPAQFALQLKNAGGAPLRILNVKPNCGCVVPRYDREIPPGGASTVLAGMDTSGLRGPVTKQLTITSDDPETPTLVVDLKVTLRRAIEVSPGQEMRVVFRRSRLMEQVAVLHSFEPAPLRILKVQSGASYVSATALPGEQEAEVDGMRSLSRQAIRLQILPSAPPQDFTVPVTVFTTSKKYPRLVLELRGEPEGGAQVFPPRIYFGKISTKPNVAVARSLVLTTKSSALAPEGGAVKLLGTESKDPALQLEAMTDRSGRFCEILVRYVGGWRPGPVKGTLVLKTSDPQRRRIEVPYTADVGE